jgi:hypothetical protein
MRDEELPSLWWQVRLAAIAASAGGALDPPGGRQMRTGPGAAAPFDWMMSLQLKGATVHSGERRN